MARETRLSEGEVPRRRLDREVTPGRCGNLDYCSIGMQRVLVQVPLSQPFVCPECASPLRAPGRRSPGGRPWLLPALRVGVLLAAMGASLVIGYTAGRAQHSVTQAVEVAGKRASEGIDAAGAVLGLATPPVAPVAANPAGESVFVAERPYPLRLSPVDASKPAVHLTREARFRPGDHRLCRGPGAATPGLPGDRHQGGRSVLGFGRAMAAEPVCALCAEPAGRRASEHGSSLACGSRGFQRHASSVIARTLRPSGRRRCVGLLRKRITLSKSYRYRRKFIARTYAVYVNV